MKLLKIVLIALVTVGIYSFTTVEKTKNQPIDKIEKVEQYNSCVTIVYKPGITDDQKRLAKIWVETRNFNLISPIEITNNYEKWSITIINPNRDPLDDKDQEDGEDYLIGREYVSLSFGCGGNNFVKID